jgi:hypothetical protein
MDSLAGGASPALPRKQSQDRARASSIRAGSLGSTEARRSAWGCCIKASKGKGAPGASANSINGGGGSARKRQPGPNQPVSRLRAAGQQNNHVAVA